MRILQIIPHLGLGGAETMCENLVYELQNLGHDVVVASMYDNHTAITDRLEEAGVAVRYLHKKTGLDFSMIWRIKQLIGEMDADVVHTHLSSAQYAMPASLLMRVKHKIHTVHSVANKENGFLARKLNGFFFKKCGLIPVSLSSIIQSTVIEEYGIRAERVPIIFNGIKLERCKPKISYKVCDMFRIVHIGSFQKVKNHECLIDAFCCFRQKYPHTRLQLIGDGTGRPDVENRIRMYGLEDAIEVLGIQQDVFPFLHNADVFALTSLYEGIPMSVIEAMGTGLPIVATAVGGVPDMLDSSMAILTSVDSSEIAKAFETYYLSENLRKEHGQRARIRSEAFSAKTMAQQYLAEYQGIERK